MGLCLTFVFRRNVVTPITFYNECLAKHLHMPRESPLPSEQAGELKWLWKLYLTASALLRALSFGQAQKLI